MEIKNKIILLLGIGILLIIIPNISAICESGQIDVNAASLEKLDELWGIGPAKGQAIIDTRPFESVDDLINVNGIGEVTLENIKSQGLACVEQENFEIPEPLSQENNETNDSETENKQQDSNEKEIEIKPTVQETTQPSPPITGNDVKEEEEKPETIEINPKDIKGEEDTQKLNKNNYIKYGLIGFCVLLALLFLFRKRSYKNEFR